MQKHFLLQQDLYLLPHTCRQAKLGNICFCSKVYSTTLCSLAKPSEDWKNIKKLVARAVLSFLS